MDRIDGIAFESVELFSTSAGDPSGFMQGVGETADLHQIGRRCCAASAASPSHTVPPGDSVP